MASGEMDIVCDDAVIQALSDTVKRGLFGYPGKAGSEYLQAVTEWQRKRFGWHASADWIVPTQGAVTALKASVEVLSRPGDIIVVQPPVYHRFFSDDVVSGRLVKTAPLRVSGDGYLFDPDLFEHVVRQGARVVLLCNPQNPIGRMWSRTELRFIGDICLKYGASIISDEVHQDLTFSNLKSHIPIASISEAYARRTITITSASKGFNLSGLQCANAIVPDETLRCALFKAISHRTTSLVNPFGLAATEAAYRFGENWLDLVRERIRENQNTFRLAFSVRKDAHLFPIPTEALFFAWLDGRSLQEDSLALQEAVATKTRIWIERGDKFGAEGRGFLRINLACSAAVAGEAAARLSDFSG